MAPPPPSRLMDITTTQFKIKRTHGGKNVETRHLKHLLGKKLMTNDALI
jgi:hypothetical protein